MAPGLEALPNPAAARALRFASLSRTCHRAPRRRTWMGSSEVTAGRMPSLRQATRQPWTLHRKSRRSALLPTPLRSNGPTDRGNPCPSDHLMRRLPQRPGPRPGLAKPPRLRPPLQLRPPRRRSSRTSRGGRSRPPRTCCCGASATAPGCSSERLWTFSIGFRISWPRW